MQYWYISLWYFYGDFNHIRYFSFPQAGSENTQSSPSLWNLREISLIHQRVLVIAEIAWDARKGAPSTTPTPGSGPGPVVYLVTWEIDGGGLKGNLFTNSTCVTLSLWPDTVCHIKVSITNLPSITGSSISIAPSLRLFLFVMMVPEKVRGSRQSYSSTQKHASNSLSLPQFVQNL